MVAAAAYASERAHSVEALEKARLTRTLKKKLVNHQQYVMDRPRRSSDVSSTPGTCFLLCCGFLTVPVTASKTAKRKRKDLQDSPPETEVAKRTRHSLSKKELAEIDGWVREHSMPENERNLTIGDLQHHVTEKYGFKVGSGAAL